MIYVTLAADFFEQKRKRKGRIFFILVLWKQNPEYRIAHLKKIGYRIFFLGTFFSKIPLLCPHFHFSIIHYSFPSFSLTSAPCSPPPFSGTGCWFGYCWFLAPFFLILANSKLLYRNVLFSILNRFNCIFLFRFLSFEKILFPFI